MTFSIPSEYPYVLAVAAGSFFVNTYHIILTSRARKASGIKYPVCYATEEQAAKDAKVQTFNCAQRAHANFTENLTSFLGGLLISGLVFPKVAAGLGSAWVLSRILYARGYVAAGPGGRRAGGGHFVADLGLKLLAGYTAYVLISNI